MLPQLRVNLNNRLRKLACVGDDVAGGGHPQQPKGRAAARLFSSEHITLTTQREVGPGELEAVEGRGARLPPLQPDRAGPGGRDEKTETRDFPPPNSTT